MTIFSTTQNSYTNVVLHVQNLLNTVAVGFETFAAVDDDFQRYCRFRIRPPSPIPLGTTCPIRCHDVALNRQLSAERSSERHELVAVAAVFFLYRYELYLGRL